MSAMLGGPHLGWQSLIRQRLEERDSKEKAFDEIIADYQRLTRHAKMLKERNASMLAASNSVDASTGTVRAATSPVAAGASVGNEPDVRQAYMASVESQLKTARDELSTLYKTQAQNAQRLISLNEQMREKDDRDRDTSDEMRRVQEEVVKLRRKEGDLLGVAGEKDKMIQMLQDELSALSLELQQVEIRNDDLKRDNANLLQRWLDRMNDEAEKMNEGNRFLQEVEHRRTTQEDTTPALTTS